MFCPNCGTQVPDNSNFCPNCAAQLNAQYNANNQYNPQGYQQPYGYGYNPDMPNPKDIPSTALNVLAFFVPIVGLILYLIWKDEYPNKAKKIGKAALISVLIGVAFYVLVFVLTFTLTFVSGVSMFEYML